MSLPVILRPEASQDLATAEAWYEQKMTGLGASFLARVSDALDRVAAMSKLYAAVWQDVRPCPIRKFPYVVYYRELTDRIEVLAVLHGHQDPSIWRARASQNP
jgi:plasmid stabilization system protein ParE